MFADMMRFIKEKKAQSEWNLVFLILVLAIVAIVLIAKLKPMFKGSVKMASKTEGVKTPKLQK